jgi:hypothetical protein
MFYASLLVYYGISILVLLSFGFYRLVIGLRVIEVSGLRSTMKSIFDTLSPLVFSVLVP